jgi:putative inorganic carbon (HCO3(-)) transporter
VPLRDLFLFGLLALLVPIILIHPYIGALVWVVFGLMAPHRLAFGPAYDFPFAMVFGILTLAGILVTRDHRQLKGGVAGVVLIIFIIWACITTVYALTPENAVPMWSRVMKIFAMTFVLMLLLHTKRHIELLLVAIVFSIGFYGVKGGIFTILTGGKGLVYGPSDSVLNNNNHLGVAVVMLIPLFAHIYQQTRNRWLRWALLACMLLCATSVLGSYSRGAVLALVAMGALLWLRSPHKAVFLGLALVTALVLIPFMPDTWNARMHTIQNYEGEGSAMSRLNSWKTAWNIGTDRFLGAGFEYPSPDVIAKYSPEQIPSTPVAHSIYFQVLGEHGFLGLGLFLLFWALVWIQSSSTRRLASKRADLRWAFSLMSMTQVSLIGYAVGGAFINIAFWDMPYYLYAVVTLTHYVVVRSVRSDESVASIDRQRMTGPLPALAKNAQSLPVAPS